jgi:hypothetical protein
MSEKKIEKTEAVTKPEQKADKPTQTKARKVAVKSSPKKAPNTMPEPVIKPSPKPSVKPAVKDTVLVAVAGQLLDRFEKAFAQAKKQKDQDAENSAIYYVFKRLDSLIDAQGKLNDEATPEDISREQQYKEHLKIVFSKGFKDVAKLTFEEAKEVYSAVKEEKKEEKKAAKLLQTAQA